jgi:GT2 family glycosyltransferase
VGLPLRHGEHLLVADAAAFVESLRRVITDSSLRDLLTAGKEGRAAALRLASDRARPRFSVGDHTLNVVSEALITTIIPTYRRPKLLERAIQSVLRQSYAHFEIHVYDNASGDGTHDVVTSFADHDRRVRYHCHERNIGPIANFAFGVAEVKTPYFNILSDDDLLAPGFFQLGMQRFARYPETMLFSGATVKADASGNVFDVPIDRFREGLYSPPEGFFALLNNGHTDWTGIIFRSEALSAVGGLDVRTGTAVDIDFEWRIAAQCPIVVSKEPVGIFFVHPSQVSSAATNYDRIESLWASWSAILDNIQSVTSLGNEDASRAAEIISRRIRRSIFLHGCDAAARGAFSAAHLAASILKRELGSPYSAFILRTFARATVVVPPALTLRFVTAMRHRRMARFRKAGSQKSNGSYEAFVRKLLSQAELGERRVINACA